MATVIVNTDPKLTQPVTVDRSNAVIPTLPTMATGEITRFSIRQNNGNGQGLIFINGQLVQAGLPPFLQPGTQVRAQVQATQDKILFRILDQLKPLANLPGGPATQLAEKLEAFTRTTAGVGFGSLHPFQLPKELSSLFGPRSDLMSLFNSLSTENLQNPASAFTQLLATTDGSLAATLRQAVENIRSYLSDGASTPPQRFLHELGLQLDRLLQSAEDNQTTKSLLYSIIDILTKEVKDSKPISGRHRALLEELLSDLRNARAEPEAKKAYLENAAQRLETSALTNPLKDQLDSTVASRLRQVLIKLEQMASQQETLTQLNPVMHALGEPALILFPFVFSGLISHSEVTIEPKRKRRRKGDNDDDIADEKGNSGGDQAEPYQRIQVSVPLPSLGNVDVDIAHRNKEILVRLTTDDPEKATFLLEQLEHLAGLLRSQGFERAELVANVGPTKDTTPAWGHALHASTSILA